MYVYGGRGRVFPNQTAVGWSLRAEFSVVGCTVTTVTTSADAAAAVSRRPLLVVQTVAVPVAVVMVVMMVVVVSVSAYFTVVDSILTRR